MAEYIDRESVVAGILNDLEPLICRDPASVQVFSAVPDEKIISYLEQFPAADVRPVVRGRWKIISIYIKCLECGERFILTPQNFCPNCGADMREDQP